MATTDSKSYEYNGICDVCGWKLKSYQLKRRWDGFMVCKHDWEPRHSLDFYKTKNDTHKLPFTRPDNQNELSWTPTFKVGDPWANTGTPALTGTYSFDGTTYTIRIVCTLASGDRVVGGSTCHITLPAVTTTNDGYTIFRALASSTMIPSATRHNILPVSLGGTSGVIVDTSPITESFVITGSFTV